MNAGRSRAAALAPAPLDSVPRPRPTLARPSGPGNSAAAFVMVRFAGLATQTPRDEAPVVVSV